MTRRACLPILVALLSLIAPSPGAAATPGCQGQGGWKLVGADVFRGADAVMRSQGVTSDGSGWIFSWQGGLQRTTDDFTPTALGTLPPEDAVEPSVDPSGQNHVGDNHIGDIDVHGGLVYAPIEDGGQSVGPVDLNNPEYQRPRIALYDASTLAYTGVSYPLDVTTHEAGVPWVAVDGPRERVYTAEWDMPHDRLNVFDLDMRFQRFLPLRYPPSLGDGFHLSRIQGAKVWGRTLFATRDDAAKTVFAIDLKTGVVTKLFSLDPAGPAELEGLAVRPTADGALLHVLIILDNQLPQDASDIRVSFNHYAPC